MRQFKVLQDFYAPEMRSAYVTGLVYLVRDNNHKLEQLAEQWAKDRKVVWIHASYNPTASISGVGQAHSKSAHINGEGDIDTSRHSVPAQDLSYWELTKQSWRALWR